MGTVLGNLLPLAMGVAISPIPIIATILVTLTNPRAGARTGFAVGSLAGIAVVTAVITILAGAFAGTGTREPSAAVSWVKIILGLLLLAIAGTQWRGRSDTTPPGWMRAMGSSNTIRSTELGAALSLVNPKNLLLCVSAGLTIGASDVSGGGQVVAIVVFTAIAGVGVLAIVIGYALAADRLQGPLDNARQWLQTNNHAVMAIVLLIMGTVLLGKGIGGL